MERKKIKMKAVRSIIKKEKVSYLFLMPYALVFFAFNVLPVIIAMILSFSYYNVLESPQFIGWQNYINLFLHDEIFSLSVKNTLLFALITGPLGYFAALFFAWTISKLAPVLRAVMVVIFYAPTISGQVYLVWKVFFSGDQYGYLNGILMRLGFIYEPIQWLQNPSYMFGCVVVVALWTSLGAGFLSFVAGFQGIDNSLYEAGVIDGIKNRWQELWFITLPSMRPQMMFGAVMSITAAFSIYEVPAMLCGFPSTDYAVHTVVGHLVDYGTIRYDMGYASAIATVLFIAMILTNKVVQYLLKQLGK